MIRKTHENLPFYEYELFQSFRNTLRHAVVSRHIDINNSGLIKNILNTDSSIISLNQQLHGTHAWLVKKTHVENINNIKQDGDILITDEPNIPLMIRIADCASIILFDPSKKIIANIHAGWRGMAKRAIHKTIKTMKNSFGCRNSNIFAAISPMLGPCCSFFSNPEEELPKALHKYISEENHVNLWAVAEGHLRECGIKKDHIENPRICTYCHPENFYSYRREGDAGRFGTIVMLRKC